MIQKRGLEGKERNRRCRSRCRGRWAVLISYLCDYLLDVKEASQLGGRFKRSENNLDRLWKECRVTDGR